MRRGSRPQIQGGGPPRVALRLHVPPSRQRTRLTARPLVGLACVQEPAHDRSRQVPRHDISLIVTQCPQQQPKTKTQLLGSPGKTSDSHNVYQPGHDPLVSMASNNRGVSYDYHLPSKEAAALLCVVFTLGPQLTEEPLSGTVSSRGRGRLTWPPERRLGKFLPMNNASHFRSHLIGQSLSRDTAGLGVQSPWRGCQ